MLQWFHSLWWSRRELSNMFDCAGRRTRHSSRKKFGNNFVPLFSLNLLLLMLLSRLRPISRGMKVYTRTGDKGSSSLFTGERRPKDDLIFEALGSVDELTSTLGLARALLPSTSPIPVDQHLFQVQCILQDVNSNIATPRTSTSTPKLQRTVFDPELKFATELEQWIDAMDLELKPLTAFILPGGGQAASVLHMSRSICRRAERRVVPLVRDEMADASCAIYLNRLSDYLFTAGRYVAMKSGHDDVIYKKQ